MTIPPGVQAPRRPRSLDLVAIWLHGYTGCVPFAVPREISLGSIRRPDNRLLPLIPSHKGY